MPDREGLSDLATRFSAIRMGPVSWVGSNLYLTAELYMMAEKAALFDDHEIRSQVLTVPSPGAAKALGRKVDDFDANLKCYMDKGYCLIIERDTTEVHAIVEEYSATPPHLNC